jgi:2-keto-3-deoxy-L-rhamnonate aldolase RhmA
MSRQSTLAEFKHKLHAGELLLGTQHNSGSEAVIEVLAYAGLDWVLIDQEHSAYTAETVERLVRAAETVDLVALVRVAENNPTLIRQALEAGAQGVLVPHVLNAADMKRALSAMRYLPIGTRGKSAMSRASGWALQEWAPYAEWANTETLCVPIIEDKEAVEVMEEILSVPGLELIAIGPGDLSQSYGMPAQMLHAPPVMAALRQAIELCKPRGIKVMTIPAPELSPELIRDLHAEGATVSWWGGDLLHLGRHLREQVGAVRALVP